MSTVETELATGALDVPCKRLRRIMILRGQPEMPLERVKGVEGDPEAVRKWLNSLWRAFSSDACNLMPQFASGLTFRKPLQAPFFRHFALFDRLCCAHR